MEKAHAAATINSMPKLSEASTSSHPSKRHVIRRLDKNEYKQAAQCLAEAFKDDDVGMYFVKTGDHPGWDAEDEWNHHVYIMECIVYAHCLKGAAYVIGPNYDCVALWMPPGGNLDSLCTMVRSGMYKLKWKLSKEGRKRFFEEFLPLLHDTKKQILGKDDNNSWYLVYIGTKTASRGRGFAKALIEHTTKQADQENRTCYLECSNPLNLKLYGRLGFNFVEKIGLRRGEKPVEMDIMTRPSVTKQLAGKTETFGGVGAGPSSSTSPSRVYDEERKARNGCK